MFSSKKYIHRVVKSCRESERLAPQRSLLLYGAGRLYAGDRLGSRLVRFRANVWRNTLFVLFLVYPMLSATLLKTFHCREVARRAPADGRASEGGHIMGWLVL